MVNNNNKNNASVNNAHYMPNLTSIFLFIMCVCVIRRVESVLCIEMRPNEKTFLSFARSNHWNNYRSESPVNTLQWIKINIDEHQRVIFCSYTLRANIVHSLSKKKLQKEITRQKAQKNVAENIAKTERNTRMKHRKKKN